MKKVKKVTSIIAKIIAVSAVILLLAALGAFYWYQNNLNSHNTENNEFIFTIVPNETLDNIMTKLEENGFTINKTAWQIYLKLNPSLGTGIQAGDFGLNSNMSIPSILQALQKANMKQGIKVTVQEGLRYDEVATILDKAFTTADPAKRKFNVNEFNNIILRSGNL